MRTRERHSPPDAPLRSAEVTITRPRSRQPSPAPMRKSPTQDQSGGTIAPLSRVAARALASEPQDSRGRAGPNAPGPQSGSGGASRISCMFSARIEKRGRAHLLGRWLMGGVIGPSSRRRLGNVALLAATRCSHSIPVRPLTASGEPMQRIAFSLSCKPSLPPSLLHGRIEI